MAQEQHDASAPPPKERKNKKRQRAATEAAAKNGSSSSSLASGPADNGSSTSARPAGSPRKQRRRNTAKQTTRQHVQELYGEELPGPRSNADVKGKGKAVRADSAPNMEDGEVDELDGLFFVDTTPASVPKMAKEVDKPVLARRTTPSPPAVLTRSLSPASQILVEDKVVPDYVGTSSEIKEVDAIRDDTEYPVEGSSKDLLNAIISSESAQTGASEGGGSRVKDASTMQDANEDTSVSALPDEAVKQSEDIKRHARMASHETDARRKETAAPQLEKRKARNEKYEGKSHLYTTSLLLEDLPSDDSSDTEEDTVRSPAKETVESESDGESSEEDGRAPHDLELNMEVDVKGSAAPPLPIEIDLTGSPVPEKQTLDTAKSAEIAASIVPLADLSMDGDASNAAAIDVIDDEDDYQADRSRYFKEDDPLKLCARCGETGHTVRDCAHVQCLTCGKLDDHGTRSCPLTMTCFRCNSRGHHIKDCPMTPEQARNGANQYCERCSSHTHKSSTCPYIWRVYIRATNAPVKPPKIHFACYNCASAEHFGDDCKFPRGHPILNSERTAFTMDPDNNRKTHIRFDPGSGNSRAIPRPQTRDVSPPPSHAPRGPRGKDAAPCLNRKERRKLEHARPTLEQEIQALKQDQAKMQDGEFGDMGDLEAGEIDEDEDAFVKRLDRNKNDPAKQPRGPRPGARDRRRAREHGSARTSRDSSVNGEQETKKTFQPFKNFAEPPSVNGNSLNRPRSLSPPPARRRQPSPMAMDSPAQARSGENWRRDKGLQSRIQAGKQAGRRGGGFASGSLLDRIDRGFSGSTSRSTASRDPRDYDARDHPASGSRPSGREPRRGGDSYVPSGDTRRSGGGANPRYKGGYF